VSTGELVQRTVEAHGGAALWAEAREVGLRLSAGGFAFASKLQGGAMRDVEARVATRGQRVAFSPYPSEGRRGVFEGGSVRIESDDGRVEEERPDARAAFPRLRRKLWWDRLDILYFGGQALWTYLSVPFVLTRPDYEVRELEPWNEDGEETWQRLGVSFPAEVHTHSREQVFYVDAQGRIRRHDYTAEPFGDWAKAAHYCHDHERFDGLLVPTRRLVFPRRPDNRPRSRPRLVWIEVGDVELIPEGGA
jgi:hypothetical protein